MKSTIFFSIVWMLFLGGCIADKAPVESSPPPPPCKEQSQQTITISSGDYELYLKAIAEQKSLYTEAIKSSNPVAPVAVLPSAPAAPSGSVQPLSSLRTFIVSVPGNGSDKFLLPETPQPVDSVAGKRLPVVGEYDDVREVVRKAIKAEEKKNTGSFDEGGVE